MPFPKYPASLTSSLDEKPCVKWYASVHPSFSPASLPSPSIKIGVQSLIYPVTLTSAVRVIPLLKSNEDKSAIFAYVSLCVSLVARFNTPSATFASPASSSPSALSNV